LAGGENCVHFPTAETFNGGSFVLITQVSVALNHLDTTPAAQLLDRPQVGPRHAKP